jgi:ABC-type lipopolysaccharide export system ATPase subunit
LDFKIVDIGFNNIDKILHVADIHIRNYTRHKEYRKVFNDLYTEVDKLSKNSIVYVGGDIVHNKTDISPELIELTSEFLKNLADRRHTILITGNHDANLNNSSRMDTLTPIIEAMNHPQLHYLRDSGVYKLADVHFTVFGIFDDPKTFIKASSFSAETKVALFHGAVNNSLTDIGFKVSNENLPLSMFDGYDMGMLGDIHKRQFYNIDQTVLQVGSLLQQNHGESFDKHGCAIWDVKTRKATFVDFKNDYGHYTIEVNSGVLSDISDIPKYPRVRLSTANCTKAEIQAAIIEIKKHCTTSDLVIKKNITDEQKQAIKHNLLKDVSDVAYQNTLLEDFVSRTSTTDPTILEKVKNINNTLNRKLLVEDKSTDISWKPNLFKFSNMFNYREDNEIDFNNIKNVVGIFAPNHAGKSAVFDSLMFCLFGKCSRTTSGKAVLNSKKSKFSCSLDLEVDGTKYVIERTGVNKVMSYYEIFRNTVDFYMINDEGEKISLNGEQRKDTDKQIQNLVGTYEDFVLTSMSVQNNNTGFVTKSQSEKKDLLTTFLDLTVLEELYNLGKEEVKSVEVLLKQFEKTDHAQLLDDATTNIEAANSKYEKYEIEKAEYTVKLNDILQTISDIKSKIKAEVTKEDVEDLNNSEVNLQQTREALEVKLNMYKEYSVTNADALYKISSQLEKQNIDILKADQLKSNAETIVNRGIQKELDILKVDIKNKLNIVSKLDTHEYDPNCNYCCDNEFVKVAQKAKSELEGDRLLVADVLDKKSLSDDIIFALSGVSGLIEIYNTNILEKNKYEKYNSEIALKSANVSHALSTNVSDIARNEKKIQAYYKNEEVIKQNKEYELILQKHILDKIECEADLSGIATDLQTTYGDIQVSKQSIDTIKDNIKRAHELEIQLKAYDVYLKAMHRDGLPYEIMANIIPILQDDVNDILERIVDFKIEFNVDGKNIESYIAYDNDKWPLEMTSGMEMFLSSLAIRVALTSISSIPKPNFLVIDEGFGNLDAKHINTLELLFDYLKLEFDFIMIISHIDTMRDMVDTQLTIDTSESGSRLIA